MYELVLILLTYGSYALESYWTHTLPQGSEQLTAWAIAGGVSSLLVIIVLNVFGWISGFKEGHWIC